MINDASRAINMTTSQTLRCIICHSGNIGAQSRATQARKGIVSYNSTHGTSSMKHHLTSNHNVIFEKYIDQLEIEEASRSARKKSKKRDTIPPTTISAFFGASRPYASTDPHQLSFMEDLLLYICKSYQPLSTVEDPWFRRLVLSQNPRVVFPSRRQLMREHLPAMVAKTMEKFVLPLLETCDTATATFDLWMSRGGVDTFTLVVNFLSKD